MQIKWMAGFAGLALVHGMVWAQSARIGVLPGIDEEVMQQAAQVAAGKGLTLQIKSYSNAGQLERALVSGEIDGASVPDAPTRAIWQLHSQRPLRELGTSITLPMGLYSRHFASLRQLPVGAKIGIPKEPQAQSRALVLLQNYGLIQFRDDAGLQARIRDITVNTRHYQLVALPQAQLWRALPTLPLVALTGDFAMQRGLFPARDAIGMEDARSPWEGVLAAASPGDWSAQWLLAYQSPKVAAFVLQRYQDSVRRPW